MKDSEKAVLELLKAVLNENPMLAHTCETIAAQAQGKGYGAATIDKEVRMVLQLLNRRPVLAIDIGGNVGDYTATLRGLDSSVQIHVFEPSAINVSRLNQRFQEDRGIVVVPLAVSDATGSSTLFANESGSGLASLTKRRLDHFHIEFENTELVNTIRFEDYWHSELQDRVIDIVKADIEGHELSALRGFGEAIHKVRVLQFEFGGTNIDTRVFFQDFWYFFKSLNFSLYRITPTGMLELSEYRETDECFQIANYIAVNGHQFES